MWSKILSLLIITVVIGLVIPDNILAQTEINPEPKVVITETQQNASDTKLMAYFFHGRKQCMSCRTIEAYAHDAINTGFAAQVSEGKIEWAKVNYDNPEFSHFKKDFELYTQSVVLVEMQKDKIIRWKNLKDVWTLVRKKEDFYKYIQKEVQAFF